jgi:hypothetical protein
MFVPGFLQFSPTLEDETVATTKENIAGMSDLWAECRFDDFTVKVSEIAQSAAVRQVMMIGDPKGRMLFSHPSSGRGSATERLDRCGVRSGSNC